MTDTFASPARAMSRVRVLSLFATVLATAALLSPSLRPWSAPSFALNIEARTPIASPPSPVGLSVSPFFLHAVNAAEQARAVRCLTDAIYYEAADQPVEGQRAIAQVVVNRVRDKHFPKSVCGVVYEGWERRTGCQFSFVCDGSIRRRHADTAQWLRLRSIAEDALNGYVVPQVGTATHYYADYVRPNWIRSVAEVTRIGAHVFCSWKGRAGLPSALSGRYAGGEFQIADQALDGVVVGKAREEEPQRDARRGERIQLASLSRGGRLSLRA